MYFHNRMYSRKMYASANPGWSTYIDYSHEMVLDLKGIIGTDWEIELTNILQKEADAKYEKEMHWVAMCERAGS